jgi:hypothetical protein
MGLGHDVGRRFLGLLVDRWIGEEIKTVQEYSTTLRSEAIPAPGAFPAVANLAAAAIAIFFTF